MYTPNVHPLFELSGERNNQSTFFFAWFGFAIFARNRNPNIFGTDRFQLLHSRRRTIKLHTVMLLLSNHSFTVQLEAHPCSTGIEQVCVCFAKFHTWRNGFSSSFVLRRSNHGFVPLLSLLQLVER